MLNFCQINLSRTIKSMLERGSSLDDIIQGVQKNLGLPDNTYITSEIKRIISQESVTMSPINGSTLTEFFRDSNGIINAKLFREVKSITRRNIISLLFIEHSTGTNSALNDNFTNFIEDLKEDYDYNDFSSVSEYFNYRSKIENNEKINASALSNFLIINYFSTIMQSWFPDIINYDGNSYSFKKMHKLAEDWITKDKEDREPELNTLLSALLEAIPVYRNNRAIPNRTIVPKAFFQAVSYEIENMPDKDFANFIENPYYIIDYLTNKYNQENIPNPHVIMQSIVIKLFGNGRNTIFSRNMYKGAANIQHHLIDIFVAQFVKYRGRTFIEHGTNGTESRIDSSLVNTTEYGRVCDYINQMNLSSFPGLFINNKLQSLTTQAALNDAKTLAKILFGNDYDFNEYKASFETFLKFVVTFKEKPIKRNNEIIKFDNFLSSTSIDSKNGADLLQEQLKIAIQYLPTAVSGTKDTKEGKAVAVFGVSSVANSMSDNIYRSRLRLNRLKSEYERAKGRISDTTIITPISPMQHTQLYGHVQGKGKTAENNIFTGTVYDVTLSTTIRKEEVTKHVNNSSTPESFILSIQENFIKGWNKGTVIRNQAITPSDKSMIPKFEWNVPNLKERYEGTNPDIEKKVLEEMQNIYGQVLFNSISDIAQVLQMRVDANGNIIKDDLLSEILYQLQSAKGDFTLVKDVEDLLDLATKLNYLLKQRKITDDVNDINGIPQLLQRFREKTGVYKDISTIHDYNVENGIVQLNGYSIMAISQFQNNKFFRKLYKDFLKDLKRDAVELNDGETAINIAALLEDDKAAYDNILYTYFLINMTLSEQVLVNTVGVAASHKHSFITEKSKNGLSEKLFKLTYNELTAQQQEEVDNTLWAQADSSSNLTMVKRMVALTATMHAGIDNVLSGMPNELRTMVIPNEVMKMFAYSGNSTKGAGWNSDFDCWDGVMAGTRITSQLMKASTADTKPEGMAEKLICHSQDPIKTSPQLYKCANTVCDNANIRMASYEYVPDDYITRNPEHFMKMQLDQAKININISIAKDGSLIDYNNNLIPFFGHYFTKPHSTTIYKIKSLKFDGDTQKFKLIYGDENGTEYDPEYFENNLYSIWKALGGAWSCDKYGNYNEASQDKIVDLINRLGTKKSDNVTTQLDVDQYLKHQLIYYFVTDSANKSLKSPIVDYKETVSNPSRRIYNKVYLNNFGYQLDPNHGAEDSKMREVSQLISFLSEDMLMPEHTRRIYQNIKRLLDTLNTKTFINLDAITNYVQRKAAYEALDKIFGKKIKRIFADPNTDAMGLANEICKDILRLRIDGTLPQQINAPYSDGQMMGKMHTTIGSHLNKYISRQWTGRADVLVPSHNMWMIYEDEPEEGELYGTTYLANDMVDGISVGKYLHDKVWNEDGTMKEDYKVKHKISATEVMPTDVYWKQIDIIDNNGNIVDQTWKFVKIEEWSDLVNVSNDINNGGQYFRAIDLPRNLRSKQVFIDAQFINSEGNIETKRIGLYHLTAFRELANLGIKLETKTFEKGETYDSILKIKKAKQEEIETTLLRYIDQENVKEIMQYIPEIYIPEGYTLQEISYICKDEERLTTNNYTNAFGIKNMNWSEASRLKDEYFYRNLVERFADIQSNDGLIVNYDFLLYDTNGKPTAIIFNKDGLDLDNDVNYVLQTPVVDEDGYRIDSEGNKTYKWPEGVKLYIRKNGPIEIETLVINDLKQTNEGYSSEALLDILQEESFIFYRTNGNFRGKLNILNLFELTEENMDSTLREIAAKQYKSWIKSNDAIMARIPSQSLSFAMAIRTVGYLPYGNNITMVPNSNVFLEGSDYDIDKVYAIMAAISHGGMYKEYKYPMTISDKVSTNNHSSEWLRNELIDIIESSFGAEINSDAYILEKLQNIAPQVASILLTEEISINAQEILNGIKLKYGQEINDFTENHWKKKINNTIIELNRLLNSQTRLEKSIKSSDSAHLQNYMLETMLEIYRSPLTLMASTSPTTMDPVNDAVKSVGGDKALRSHFSPSSTVYINQTTAVGKKDIGISAVAQKAFYALNYYDYVRKQKGQSIFNFDSLKLPEDWGGTTVVSLGFPNTRIDRNSLELLYKTLVNENKYELSGTVKYKGITFKYRKDSSNNIPVISILANGKERLLRIGDRLADFVVTTINSAIISSSTDNAKEMMMDLLNATPEVLPAYEYLLSIGVDLKQAAKILTDDLLKCIITVTRGNLFKGDKGYYKTKDIFDSNPAVEKVKKLYSNYGPVDDKIFEEKMLILKKLFEGAQELTVLGQSLGINQGMDVDFGDPLLYKLNMERQVYEVTKTKFRLDEFLDGDPDQVQQMIDLYEEHKTKYNLLDIMYNVEHYRAMFRLPLQFENTVRILSKDVDSVYSIASKHPQMRWNSDKLRMLERAVNDQKVFEFFKKYPFNYNSTFFYDKKGVRHTAQNGTIDLSTDSIEGIMTLKKYIEEIIWPVIINNYPDNDFVYNLVHAQATPSLFTYPIGVMGSRIKLSDPNNEDILFIIKDAFNNTMNDEINGHSIYEWMYVYDLLVYKHTMSKNAFTLLFQDHVNLQDQTDINTKWVKYISIYDSGFDVFTTSNYPVLRSLAEPKSKETRENSQPNMDDFDYTDEGAQTTTSRKTNVVQGVGRPDILPLYVIVDNNNILHDRNALEKLFNSGHLPVKTC